jgi:hypothetical protein
MAFGRYFYIDRERKGRVPLQKIEGHGLILGGP